MVIVKNPLVENTIDQQLWQMLLAKRQVSMELIKPEADQEALAKSLLAATIVA
ncbi:hypothetical protein [Pseudomonas delhiensis]|uniref:hypothetical protein n=1 Tax=Pseudomonas delhiensis TaxID=366289 RepID=UPI00315B0386